MPRGGRRSGKPGKSYPNRTDLPTAPDPGAGTFKGQPYGAATAQAAVAASGGAGAPPGGPPAASGAPPGPMIPPGAGGAFNRPTERPGEPLTQGVPIGPGAGPEALGLQGKNDAVSLQLRALYQRFPIPEIGALLSEL